MLHVMLVIILDHTSAWASSSPSSPSPSPSIFYVWDLLLQFSHIPLVLHRVPCDPLVSTLVIKSSWSKSKSKCIIDQWPRTKAENNPIMTCKMKNLPIWTCRLVKSFFWISFWRSPYLAEKAIGWNVTSIFSLQAILHSLEIKNPKS